MIGRLSGEIIDIQPPQLLIDVAGVGYEVFASMNTIFKLPADKSRVTLYTHLIVREDAHLLFGFYHINEREWFRALIKVNGVGPKLALSILSSMSVEDFVQCIQDDHTTRLVKIPGVGQKTAQRLVVELRDRLTDLNINLAGQTITTSYSQDAIGALVALGYKMPEATRVVKGLKSDDPLSREELIRQALQQLSG